MSDLTRTVRSIGMVLLIAFAVFRAGVAFGEYTSRGAHKLEAMRECRAILAGAAP